MGVNWKQQKIGSKYLSFLVNFWLKCFNFLIFHLSTVKETIVVKKSGGHCIGFKIILNFVLKIVLADTGYIEVQYTKIKSEQIECTCHSPKPHGGAKDARMGRSPYTGTIMQVRVQLGYYCYA